MEYQLYKSGDIELLDMLRGRGVGKTAINDLFEDGKVTGPVVAAVATNLLAKKLVIDMPENDHPMTEKLAKRKKEDRDIGVYAVIEMAIPQSIADYLAEKAISPQLKFSDSHASKVLKSNIQGQIDANPRLPGISDSYNTEALARSLPSLVQESLDEAILMIQAIARSKAPERSSSIV